MKICFVFCHFQYQDGVCRSAIAIANILSERSNIEVTLIPLFKYDKDVRKFLNASVNVKPFLGFYFRGIARLFENLPQRLLYKFIIREYYDYEIAFQYGPATTIMSHSTNNNAKHFVWMHGYDYGLRLLDCYKRFDKIICVSKQNANRLEQESGLMIPIDYSYNPIDDISIRKQGEQAAEMKETTYPRFVTVGRNSEEKGFDRLIKVSKRLIDEGLFFELLIIGDGPMHGQLKQLTKELNIEDYIHFLGAQENPHKYTSKSDLFICSSYTEGYSTACAEAIILGIPVLTTDVSGAKEIIEDSGAGQVVDNNDESLYLGIKDVLLDRSIINKWKANVICNNYKFSQTYRKDKLFNVLNIDKDNENN